MLLLNSKNRTAKFKQLFSDHRHLRVGLDSALNSDLGLAYANKLDNFETGFLRLGTFCYVGGKASEKVIPLLKKGDTLIFDDSSWKSLFLNSQKSEMRLTNRYPFSNTSLNQSRLLQIVKNIPAEFEIKAITLELAKRLNNETEATCIYPDPFPSAEDFIRKGFGFCVIDKRNTKIVSSCTSADIFGDDVEIQVNTALSSRGLGLGKAVSATFLLHCMQQNLQPHWDARNNESSSLAQALGFTPLKPYEVCEII